MPKFEDLNFFEFLSGFDEIKTFIILSKISENFAYNFFLNLLHSEILSFKNADFCSGAHIIKITAVVAKVISTKDSWFSVKFLGLAETRAATPMEIFFQKWLDVRFKLSCKIPFT